MHYATLHRTAEIDQIRAARRSRDLIEQLRQRHFGRVIDDKPQSTFGIELHEKNHSLVKVGIAEIALGDKKLAGPGLHLLRRQPEAEQRKEEQRAHRDL